MLDADQALVWPSVSFEGARAVSPRHAAVDFWFMPGALGLVFRAGKTGASRRPCVLCQALLKSVEEDERGQQRSSACVSSDSEME